MRSPFARQTTLFLVVVGIVVSLSAGAVIGAARIANGPGDRVMVLGSGDGVSVLIATETSRLLLTTGNDTTAFGNAYARTAFIPRPHPDILLLAGEGRLATVSADASGMFRGAKTFRVAGLPPAGSARSDSADGEKLPADPIRFTLDGRLTVTVETASLTDGDDTSVVWRVSVVHGNSHISAVSTQDAVEAFDWTIPVSVVIFGSDSLSDPRILHESLGASVVIAAAPTVPMELTTLERLRSDAGGMQIVPVRPGGLATLTFIPGGIRLLGDDVVYEVPESSGPR